MTSTSDAPGRVFHYTNRAGLIGILNSQTLWATAAEFLNDDQEIRYAVGLVAAQLKNSATPARYDLPMLDLVDRFIEEMWRQLPAHEPFELLRESEPYLVSFCKRGDLLSMWRAYGADGGFAIEFDTAQLLAACDPLGEAEWDRLDGEAGDPVLESRMLNSGLSASAHAVSYGSVALQGLTDSILGRIAQRYDDIRDLAAEVVAMSIKDLLKIKHPAFREEEEVRLIVFEEGDLAPPRSLRELRHHLGVYQVVHFPLDAIRSVTVGPGPYSARNRLALQRAFATDPAGRFNSVELRVSGAPLIS